MRPYVRQQRHVKQKQQNKCVVYTRNIAKEHSYIKYKIRQTNQRHPPQRATTETHTI